MNYYKITTTTELHTYTECKVNDEKFTGDPNMERNKLRNMLQVAGALYVNRYVKELQQTHSK
jgi:hypothetical protein